MNDWLRYANQGATRNQPLSQQLIDAMSFLPDMGLSMEVFSGGQPSAGNGARVGSVRHDHGDAGDVFFYQGDRRLDWANPDDLPIFEDIVGRARQAGVTGMGAGPGYMRPGSMHIGFGAPSVWGAGGRRANAPEWLVNAYNGAPAGRTPAPSNVVASAQPGITMGSKPATPPARPSAPKDTDNFNFSETPLGEILGIKTGDSKISRGGMGDALSLIANAMGNNSTPAPAAAPPPPAHIPQVDPTFLSRIALGR